MSQLTPSFPIDYDTLKEELRKGLTSNASREYWWPVLVDISPTEMYTQYPDVIGSAERLHDIMKEPLLNSKTQTLFPADKKLEFIMHQSKMIMYILRNNKKLETSETPYFETIIRVVSNVIRRIDV